VAADHCNTDSQPPHSETATVVPVLEIFDGPKGAKPPNACGQPKDQAAKKPNKGSKICFANRFQHVRLLPDPAVQQSCLLFYSAEQNIS
jgi:hypothetical protein